MSDERWMPPPKTPEALAALAAAEADREARPERYVLDVDQIAMRAARAPGDLDRFAPGWRTGLDHYLASAREDGRLHALGMGMVASTAVGRLRAGAAMHAAPAGHRTPLASPPIVITGGWRTGTTYLFRLLATDARLRAPLPAELSDPTRLAGLSPAERTSFVERAGAAHAALHALNPSLQAIHDSGPWLPEECVLGMGTDLRNWGFTSTTRLDGYADWLADEDLSGGYERYRAAIETLDDGDGRRWVLKAPAHLAELDHLVEAFPGAVVVILHRDIVETVASGASLFATFRSMYSDEVDAHDVGRFQAVQTERWFRRAAAFRDTPAAAATTIIDLDYRRLVTDTPTVVREVLAAADMEPPTDVPAFIEAHARAQPRHGHGTHRYSAASFGLDPDELRERFSTPDTQLRR